MKTYNFQWEDCEKIFVCSQEFIVLGLYFLFEIGYKS